MSDFPGLRTMQSWGVCIFQAYYFFYRLRTFYSREAYIWPLKISLIWLFSFRLWHHSFKFNDVICLVICTKERMRKVGRKQTKTLFHFLIWQHFFCKKFSCVTCCQGGNEKFLEKKFLVYKWRKSHSPRLIYGYGRVQTKLRPFDSMLGLEPSW